MRFVLCKALIHAANLLLRWAGHYLPGKPERLFTEREFINGCCAQWTSGYERGVRDGVAYAIEREREQTTPSVWN